MPAGIIYYTSNGDIQREIAQNSYWQDSVIRYDFTDGGSIGFDTTSNILHVMRNGYDAKFYDPVINEFGTSLNNNLTVSETLFDGVVATSEFQDGNLINYSLLDDTDQTLLDITANDYDFGIQFDESGNVLSGTLYSQTVGERVSFNDGLLSFVESSILPHKENLPKVLLVQNCDSSEDVTYKLVVESGSAIPDNLDVLSESVDSESYLRFAHKFFDEHFVSRAIGLKNGLKEILDKPEIMALEGATKIIDAISELTAATALISGSSATSPLTGGISYSGVVLGGIMLTKAVGSIGSGWNLLKEALEQTHPNIYAERAAELKDYIGPEGGEVVSIADDVRTVYNLPKMIISGGSPGVFSSGFSITRAYIGLVDWYEECCYENYS